MCQTLIELDSRRAVPGLVDALSDNDEQLRLNAWDALKRLTGEDLPLEVDRWSELAFE